MILVYIDVQLTLFVLAWRSTSQLAVTVLEVFTPATSVGGNHAAGFLISHLPSALIFAQGNSQSWTGSGRNDLYSMLAQCALATAFPKPKSLPD